jgi:Ca2+-binding RTX toxin-like protein
VIAAGGGFDPCTGTVSPYAVEYYAEADDPGGATPLIVSGMSTINQDIDFTLEVLTCNGLTPTVVLWEGNQSYVDMAGVDDVIVGSPLGDDIESRGGDDVVCGLGGDDLIKTGAGIDWVDGGDGNDIIRLGARNDTAYGGAGADVINGGGGIDYIDGGPDDDVIWDSFGADTQVYGGTGDDLFVVGRGDANHYYGGDGSDRIDYRFMPSGVTINLISGTTAGGSADTFTSIEEARGSRHTDVITGDGADNILIGFSGHDWIHGGAGNDNLVGDKGDDTLTGGDGWDRLVGGDYDETTGDYCLEGENIHPTCEHTSL